MYACEYDITVLVLATDIRYMQYSYTDVLNLVHTIYVVQLWVLQQYHVQLII
jgi:hypothetical protein